MTKQGVVFLVSGGMDSMVGTDLIRQEARLRVLPLFVDYGQPARRQESRAASAFCRSRHLPLTKVSIHGYLDLLRGRQAASRGTASAFLPGRNLLLLTVAALVARRIKARFIGIGAIADQLFPDSTDSFFNSFNAIAPMAFDHETSVMSPLVHTSKRAVVELGRRMGTPLEQSYSCYIGRPRQCGRCMACRLRAKALR